MFDQRYSNIFRNSVVVYSSEAHASISQLRNLQQQKQQNIIISDLQEQESVIDIKFNGVCLLQGLGFQVSLEEYE